MGGSSEGNPVKSQKSIASKPLAPPVELVNCFDFHINRKVLKVGLDPKDRQAVVAIIIAPTNHVTMPYTCLTQIYSMIDFILSVVCEPRSDGAFSYVPLVNTETTTVSCYKHREHCSVVIESKANTSSSVTLGSEDVFALNECKSKILWAIDKSLMNSRPTVIQRIGALVRENVENQSVPVAERPKSDSEVRENSEDENKTDQTEPLDCSTSSCCDATKASGSKSSDEHGCSSSSKLVETLEIKENKQSMAVDDKNANHALMVNTTPSSLLGNREIINNSSEPQNLNANENHTNDHNAPLDLKMDYEMVD